MNPFTIIHGTVEWRKKDVIKTEASDVGLEYQVSHNWAGGVGLMVEIIGATRYGVENPTLPLYIVPPQPLSSPSLPANPTAAQMRTLKDKNKLLKRYWAVVRGFRRGISENIRDELDLEFLESLQHVRCN